MLRLSPGAAGRGTSTSGRDACRSGAGCVGIANSGGRGGGRGKLSVSPISGKSRAGGVGRLPTGGIAGAGAGGNGSRLGSGNGAEETGGAASRLATCGKGAAGAAGCFNWASRFVSMTMSPKGFETAGDSATGDDEVHREKISSGAGEPRQCSTQTPTAPASATAAAPGSILRRTRRGLSPPSNERSSNVASVPCIPRPTLTPGN